MPSGRRRQQPEPKKPIFFLDRGLGRYVVADAIRDQGFSALPMADVYSGKDEGVKDEEWILRADREGWIALTKDYVIVRDHRDALSKTSLRVFALNNANLTGSEMADRVVQHLNRILRAAAKPGPYVYVIGSRSLELRWRPED